PARVAPHPSPRPHRQRRPLAPAARRRFRELHEGDRSPRPADRPLRLSDAAADFARRGVLSDPWRGCRFPETTGPLTAGRELARAGQVHDKALNVEWFRDIQALAEIEPA